MDSLWNDVRYALRAMRGAPAFTSLAVLTLALGIGATTAMFSVIYNVLFDPFPYRAERVVMFQIRDAAQANVPQGRTFFQAPEFLDYREQSTVFEDVIGGSTETVFYRTDTGTEIFNAALVTGNLFEFLAVPAQVGRTLNPADTQPGAAPVFVMSHKTWRRYFNEDPGIVGRSFTLNGVPTTLVGIMPARFTKQAADIYKPAVIERSGTNYFMFQGRLRPGVTLGQAEAELDLVARRVAKTYPQNYPERFVVKVVHWVDNVVSQFKQTLLTLAAAVGLLLLISCGNVANMLLARAASRSREMAVRAALGASRGRLVRQLLVENLMLALLAAVAGCFLASAGLKPLVAAIPEGAIPREAVIRLNVPVLLFSLAATMATTLVFGLAPALQATRRDLADPLRDAGKGSGTTLRGGRLRSALVVAEVALSLVLLTSAGLMMRSFVKLQTTELGFEPEQILSVRIPFPPGQYQTAAEKQRFFAQLLPRLRSVPGVEAVATGTSLPPLGGIGTNFEIPGRTEAVRPEAVLDLCSEDIFRVMGIQLLRGRGLTEADVAAARNVVVINQSLASRYFGADDPVGRQIVVNRLANMHGRGPNPLFEVIGVVSDVRNIGVERPVTGAIYAPYSLVDGFNRNVFLRAAGDASGLADAARRAVWAVDANVAIGAVNTLEGFLRQDTYASPRFSLMVFGVFAAVGLVLITIGVYSVMSYTVRRRTPEIGIRMALGATQADVLGHVLRQGLGLLGLGTVIGLAVSVAVTRVLTSQLRGIEPNDPLTLALVLAVVAATGLVACWIPARRATKVDPMVALREP